MKCPVCNNIISDDCDFCPECGAKINISEQSGCRNCGTPIAPGAQVCPNCGMAYSNTIPNNNQPNYSDNYYGQNPQYHTFQRSRIIAAALALIGGIIGLDEFYLGNTGLGILRIILTIVTLGFASSIWALVKMMLLLTYVINTDSYGIPLKDFNF